mgnify:CR=1 FL=1
MGGIRRTERIWITKASDLHRLVFDLAHLRNLVLLFTHHYHKPYGVRVTPPSILYSLLADKLYARTPKNKAKMRRIRKILENVARNEKLVELLSQLREQKRRIDNAPLVQYILRQVWRDFRSYFSLLKRWMKNPNSLNGKPRPPMPRKLRNLHHFTIEFNRNTFVQDGRTIRLRLRTRENIGFTLKLSREHKVSSVRLRYYLGQFYADVVYEHTPRRPAIVGNHAAAIDLNLDNLPVIVSTKPLLPSLIIDGKEVKAFNQWFNKLKSKYQSEHDIILNEIKRLRGEGANAPEELLARERELRRRLRMLYVYRKKRLDDLFHKLSRGLAEFLYHAGHGVLVIGKGALEAEKKLQTKLEDCREVRPDTIPQTNWDAEV